MTSPPVKIGPHWMILWPFDPKSPRRGGVERTEHRTHAGSHHHPPRHRRTQQGFTESNTAAADPGVRPRTSARPASRRGPSRRRASHFPSVTSTTFSAPAGSPWPTGSEPSASNAAATTSPRRPFTPPRSHRSHADGDSPIPQALPARSKTPTACRHASGATNPTLGDPSPRASSSISSAHRLHNTVQGPHGRVIRAPGTFASS
jgi:hypothetical protein